MMSCTVRTPSGTRPITAGHDHGSGVRLSDPSNLCTLPARTRSLSSLAAKIIPRTVRIGCVVHDMPACVWEDSGMVPDERILASHWLYEWIDEEGIRGPGDYLKAIRKRTAIDRLHEISNRVYSRSAGRVSSVGGSVVAGRQLDLSGALGCSHFDCQVPTVNSLFGRVWHYFDTVVIDEVSLDQILAAKYDFREDLLQRVKLLLYLRDIGADKYVEFAHKVSGMCNEHFREYAERKHLGIDAIFSEDLERTVVQRIAAEGRFIVFPHDDGSWHYEIRHPDMGMITGKFAHSDMDHRPANEDIARDAFGAYCCGLIADVSASRTL